MPCSGAACACACVGRIPGSASAAAISAADGSRSALGPLASLVAATSTTADGTAAGRTFLALIDVLRAARGERIAVEAHRRPCEIAFLPRLRRLERRAAGER